MEMLSEELKKKIVDNHHNDNSNHGVENCAVCRAEAQRKSELDKDGWPKRWSDPTYLGDGPWGA